MSKKIIAIVGSYRKKGIIDQVTDAMIEQLRSDGHQVEKIYLLDLDLQFCTNCRICNQQAGLKRGICPLPDDLNLILDKIEKADGLIIGSPINFWNINALTRKFMERLVGYAYWPWGKHGPVGRNANRKRKAIIITSSAMPSLLIPLFTGATRALKGIVEVMGGKVVGRMLVGMSCSEEKQILLPSTIKKAQKVSLKLI